ncbi:MAG: LegC family aminotransferase [Verrucomicrobiae bacterium]|nr:LegC family aminotransferase [Verrucomicrobiae bacterium]
MLSDPIPLCVPEMSGGEWGYIRECLDTNWVSYVGPFVERFENSIAAITGAEHAVAMNSGTAALHTALAISGVKSGDEVIMPAVTFVAPGNAVRYQGAWPSFVDIDLETWQMDVDKLAWFLSALCEKRTEGLYNIATGRRIAALMPVHLLGGMFDVDAIASLAFEYDLPLIEDAAECLGAKYRGRGIGAEVPSIPGCRRIVCTSFNGNKIVTTGGGGALLTNDLDSAMQAKHLSTTAKADPIEFFHDAVGYNYRLTNIAAAMGVAQLEVLYRYVDRKRAIADRYSGAFQGIADIITHPEPPDTTCTYWMYTVLLNRRARPVVDALLAEGIGSRPIWRPLNVLPAFENCFSGDLTATELVCERAISLPCSVGLSESEQSRVIDVVKGVLF